jgi:WD40 repeat protein
LEWFNPKAGKAIRAADLWAAVRPAFSADGKLVATGGRHTIRVWEVETGKSVVPVDIDGAPADEVYGVAVSPDGKWIVTRGMDDGGIRVWDAAGKLKAAFPADRQGNQHPLFSPDGRYLYGKAMGVLAVARFDFPSGKESARYTFAEPPADDIYIQQFGLSADGGRLAAITRTNRGLGGPGPGPPPTARVTVWDVAGAKPAESYEVKGIQWTSRGAISPDLRWYFAGRRGFSLTGGPDYGLELPDEWQSERAAVSLDGRLVAQGVYEPAKKDVDGRTWNWPGYKGVIVHETATGKRVLTVPVTECGAMAFTPDGRGLVVTDADGIARWDLATRKPVVRQKAPGPSTGYFRFAFTNTLALFPDGKKAVTGHIDTTALVWDLTPPARSAKKMTEGELAAAWADLAGDDAGKAYATIWAMADASADAVPFLRARVKPAAAPTEDDVRTLVAKLDAAAFADREAAAAAIRELGDAAAPVLRTLVKGKLSAEQAGRVERLLAEAEAPVLPPGERLRRVRAVAVLEWAGTAEARKVLAELAAGTAVDRPTREAKEAVRRLAAPR